MGFDVLPSAVHLTVSSLASIFPKKIISSTNIGTAMFGKKDDLYHLGSLDLILPETTLDKKGIFLIGNKAEEYTDHGIRDESINYVIMNPPFTSNTREGGKEGHAMFASFDMNADIQKEMSRFEKKRFENTCADGNAGYATHFIAIADKKLSPNGTMGMVLPSTLSDGSSWEKCRSLIRLKYKDIIIVSIAGSSTNDGSFSFDTSLNELLIVATKESPQKIKIINEKQEKINGLDKYILINKNLLKKKLKTRRRKIPINEKKIQKILTKKTNEKNKLENELHKMCFGKRGKFVTIDRRPESILSAMEMAKQIIQNDNLLKLEGNKRGSTPIIMGERKIGNIMDCPIDFDWWFVGVNNAYLLQIGYKLINGKLSDLGQKQYDIPITTLGDNFGPLSRDIADKKPNDKRSPFILSSLDNTVNYFGLSNNDNKSQRSIIVQPDCMAIPKNNADDKHIEKIINTATHLHINILARYTSQRLIVLYTKKKTLGTGASLPSYNIAEKYEKAFAIWSNSTFGIFLFWLNSGKQQFGRGISSRTAMRKMSVLDFTKLNNDQINQFDKLFDMYGDNEMMSMKHMNDDNIRKNIDQEILKILRIDWPIDELREKLCQEPTISGGSK